MRRTASLLRIFRKPPCDDSWLSLDADRFGTSCEYWNASYETVLGVMLFGQFVCILLWDRPEIGRFQSGIQVHFWIPLAFVSYLINKEHGQNSFWLVNRRSWVQIPPRRVVAGPCDETRQK